MYYPLPDVNGNWECLDKASKAMLNRNFTLFKGDKSETLSLFNDLEEAFSEFHVDESDIDLDDYEHINSDLNMIAVKEAKQNPKSQSNILP